jgi:hypothetical protein
MPFRKVADRSLADARTNSNLCELGRITRIVDGRPRIVDDPPLVVHHPDDLASGALDEILRSYQRKLRSGLAILLNRFTVADYARKAVGIGSLGTHWLVVLMVGSSEHDSPFLQ